MNKQRENAAHWIAAHLPRIVQKWVIVHAAVLAREPERKAGNVYCGPDGLTYKDLHDAIERVRLNPEGTEGELFGVPVKTDPLMPEGKIGVSGNPEGTEG